MNLKPVRVKFINEKVYIECRECNTYFEIDEKNQKYICPMCSHEEDLVVINEKGSNKNEKKRRK